MKKYTNNLIHEDSPYLQQHAHNPVEWYAWGEEAFTKAKNEDKLIFLSIGYSTCHWCHVMEHESFENEEVANLLRKYYVSIKVDREEMPHIDKYYQDVHNLLNKRGGGWPLSIIMTPNAKAFFAATYVPLEPRYGMSGIKELLLHLEGVYRRDNEKVIKSSHEIERILKEHKEGAGKQRVALQESLVVKFIDEVKESFDEKYFGIGAAPKFPHASTIETLLDIYALYKNDDALIMATSMLQAMANGGINDQIEGGFYRYSVDAQWQVPHFEKMLYTNAELLSCYAKAYEITQDEFYQEVVESIVAFVDERFEVEGLFQSASDADSLLDKEKEEGAYFVFSYDETKEYLEENGFENSSEILEYFNITKGGNFERNTTNPYLTCKEKPANVVEAKKALKTLRSTREYPFIDYKILTSWNAMYIDALFVAGFKAKALLHVDRLLESLHVDGVLYHQKLVDKPAKVKALLEDYSFLISALLQAYEYSLEDKYLQTAYLFINKAKERFYSDGLWYMSDDAFRSVESLYDNSYKSSLSVMIGNLQKLAVLHDDIELLEIAQKSLHVNSLSLDNAPGNMAWLLRTFMLENKGYVCIKSTKENLINKRLAIPHLVKKVENTEEYMACRVGSCFAKYNKYEEFLRDIKML